jgi:hypothetical protein
MAIAFWLAKTVNRIVAEECGNQRHSCNSFRLHQQILRKLVRYLRNIIDAFGEAW